MKATGRIAAVIYLLIGVIIGILIMYFSGFKPGSCCSGFCTTGLPPVRVISTKEAVAAINCYRKNPVSVDSLKGFTVNLEQLHAMNKLFMDNQKLTGFRLYFGIIGDPVDVSIVCGVTENNDQTETNYVSYSRGSGPCPHFCDTDSELEAAGR
jgi:hypothetical protein